MYSKVDVTRQNTKFWIKTLTSEPTVLIAGMLTPLVFSKRSISIDKAIIPEGKEYISVEKFPVNRLPKITLTVSPKKENKLPAEKKVNKIKILDNPNFAPGIIMGGNKFSRVKAIKASEVNIADTVIFFMVIDLFIITP